MDVILGGNVLKTRISLLYVNLVEEETLVAYKVKVRVAGMGVCYSRSSEFFNIYRQESVSAIIINSRNINVSSKYMKVSFSSNKEKA